MVAIQPRMVPKINAQYNPFTTTDQKQVYAKQMQEKFPKSHVPEQPATMYITPENQQTTQVMMPQTKYSQNVNQPSELKINDTIYKPFIPKPQQDPMKKIMDQGIY